MADKDELVELLMEEEEEEEPQKIDMTTLQQELAELKKEKQGLLKGIQQERQKRQEISGRLTQLSETVNDIIERRSKEKADGTDATPKKGGIPVTFTEDGEGYVDPAYVNQLITPYQEQIYNLEKQLQLAQSQHRATTEADRVKQSIIGENERYNAVANKYQAARKWVEDRVLDFVEQNGIRRQLTSGEALTLVFDKDLRNEFSEQFPDARLMDIVTAEDSPDHFRMMLDNLANKLEIDTTKAKPDTPGKTDSRFQKVLQKPSSLGTTTNAKAGHLSVVERAGQLSAEDIMDLTDAQIEALEKAMADEEKIGGIDF